MLYLSIKAAHIIFMVAWMASLLIFPRYKLHQLHSTPGEPLFETMKDASARLRRIIMTPSIILVWLLGLTMVGLNTGLLSQGWMHVKLLLVFGLSGLHGYLVSLGRKIDAGESSISMTRMKLLNEVPFVTMIVIVILAVLKPF
ncbi:MAG: CopD family protein [Pseudomonadota bacterium]